MNKVLLGASFIVNIVGGLAFITVGVLLLALRPARTGAVGLAAFALATGGAHLFGNLGSAIGPGGLGPLLVMLRLPFQLVAPIAILWGATQYPAGGSIALVLPFLASAILGAVLLVIAPGSVVTPAGFYAPLGDLLFMMVYFAGIALASVILAWKHRLENSPRIRQEFLLLLMATVPTLGYTGGFSLVLAWTGRAFFTPLVATGYLVTFALCVGAVGWVSYTLIRDGERAARWLAFGSLALVVVGATQSYLVEEWAQFGGLLRIAAAILLGYALLKFQVFGIDRGAWFAVRAALVGGVLLLGFTLASELAENFIAARYSLSAGGAVVVAILLGLSPLSRASEKLASRVLPDAKPSADYVPRRREDMYRACLEALMVDGQLDAAERGTLDRFAQRVGLTIEEREAIEAELDQGRARRSRALPS